jgi:hypothetical protein
MVAGQHLVVGGTSSAPARYRCTCLASGKFDSSSRSRKSFTRERSINKHSAQATQVQRQDTRSQLLQHRRSRTHARTRGTFVAQPVATTHTTNALVPTIAGLLLLQSTDLTSACDFLQHRNGRPVDQLYQVRKGGGSPRNNAAPCHT